MRKLYLCMRAMVLLVLIVSATACACGRNRGQSDGQMPEEEPYVEAAEVIEVTDAFDGCPFTPYFENRYLLYGEVLTITVPDRNNNNRNEVQRALTTMFERQWSNYNITIRLSFVDCETFEQQMMESLIEGTADTLIGVEFGFADGSSGLDWRDPEVSKMFADMWPVIRADPAVNYEDFSMNIFDAMTLSDGTLRVLPNVVSYESFMANLTIFGLAHTFAEYEAVSIDDLHWIYGLHAINTGHYIYFRYGIIEIAKLTAGEFLNLADRTADFNNRRFIDLLLHAKAHTNADRDKLLGYEWYFTRGIIYLNEDLAETYAFMPAMPLWHVHELLTLAEFDRLFSHPLPFVSKDGELLITPIFPYAVCANASYAQRVLAWEFLKFLNHSDRLPPLIGLRVMSSHFIAQKCTR